MGMIFERLFKLIILLLIARAALSLLLIVVSLLVMVYPTVIGVWIMKLILTLVVLPWNHPTVWGSLRVAYVRVSKSEKFSYEFKFKLYKKLTNRMVFGLDEPRRPGEKDKYEMLRERQRKADEEMIRRRRLEKERQQEVTAKNV